MKDYVEKLQKDINTLSDNSIGCSGVLNFNGFPDLGSKTFANQFPVNEYPFLYNEAVNQTKNPTTEKPSKKMESYPKKAKRKIRID